MEGYSKQQIAKGRAKFITMFIIGIILFLIPVPFTPDGEKQSTLPVDFLANWLKGLLGDAMPIIIILIITLSAILTVLYSTIFKNKVKPGG
ncbi:YjiH family protein, partial [Streptococcus equi]|nr:YjiH family protein [Streptococcus equi]